MVDSAGRCRDRSRNACRRYWSLAYDAGLKYASRQLQEAQLVADQARKIAQGELLLHLEERFDKHENVHELLRPGGKWHANAGPVDNISGVPGSRS
jgi:hypothetical protein